jgi:hypothetical protein
MATEIRNSFFLNLSLLIEKFIFRIIRELRTVKISFCFLKDTLLVTHKAGALFDRMFVAEGEELHTGQLLRNLATGLTNRCLAIHFSMICSVVDPDSDSHIRIDLALLGQIGSLLRMRIRSKEQRNIQKSTNKPDFQPFKKTFLLKKLFIIL